MIKPLTEMNSDVEFGLIGNKRLLFSTSVFSKHLKKKGNPAFSYSGNEFKGDHVSMMMIGEGIRTKVIDWPEHFKETGYHMILFAVPKPVEKEQQQE